MKAIPHKACLQNIFFFSADLRRQTWFSQLDTKICFV